MVVVLLLAKRFNAPAKHPPERAAFFLLSL
jgi:hypothetical protein